MIICLRSRNRKDDSCSSILKSVDRTGVCRTLQNKLRKADVSVPPSSKIESSILRNTVAPLNERRVTDITPQASTLAKDVAITDAVLKRMESGDNREGLLDTLECFRSRVRPANHEGRALLQVLCICFAF